MALLKCDICGGKIAVQAGGKTGVCDSCGAAYTLDRMREIASGVKVSQTGTKEDVEQWRTLLATYLRAYDFDGVEKTVKKMLEASPSDEEANRIYGKLQDWKFYEIKNGILVKYHGQAERTEIPAGVTCIDEEAFNGCASLTSIRIPDSVTSIGDSAFSGCTSLTSIRIPDSVTCIGDDTFWRCTSLTSITIPDSVTSIGDRAFYGCTGLASIKLPDGVTRIGKHVFGDTPFPLDWRRRCLCQHCGGKFEGLMFEKCRRCGKPKDY